MNTSQWYITSLIHQEADLRKFWKMLCRTLSHLTKRMHRSNSVSHHFSAIESGCIHVDLHQHIMICFLLSSLISLAGRRKVGIRKCVLRTKTETIRSKSDGVGRLYSLRKGVISILHRAEWRRTFFQKKPFHTQISAPLNCLNLQLKDIKSFLRAKTRNSSSRFRLSIRKSKVFLQVAKATYSRLKK